MYDPGTEGSLPIAYRGFRVEDASRLTRDELQIAIGDTDKPGRERLYSIVRELVSNAEKYGLQDGPPPQFEVNADHLGTYVEVISFGRLEDVSKLEDVIRTYAFATDQELHATEMQTIALNYQRKRSGEADISAGSAMVSGIGMLQVLRRSRTVDGRRAVEVRTDPVGNKLRVRVRAYVI